MIAMFLGWKLFKKTNLVSLDEMDLVTNRYHLEDEETHASSHNGEAALKRSWFHKLGMGMLKRARNCQTIPRG